MTDKHSFDSADSTAELAALQAEHARLELRLQAREAELAALRNSWWWKLGSPLRHATHLLHPTTLKQAFLALVDWVLARPQLADRLNRWLLRYAPTLHRRLWRAVNGEPAQALPGAERTQQTEQDAGPSSLARFAAERLRWVQPLSPLQTGSITVAAAAWQREHQLQHSALSASGLGLETNLIAALRSGAHIAIVPPPDAEDEAVLCELARHVELVLLQRYPPPHVERQFARRLIAGESLHSLLQSKSPKAGTHFKIKPASDLSAEGTR